MTEHPAFPRKLFYRIQEASAIVGVEAYVLRYWETRFPQLKPERFGNDQRRYRQADIELLLYIRDLLYDEKYTIEGAIERLQRDKEAEQVAEPIPLQRPPVLDDDETDGHQLHSRIPLAMQMELLEEQEELEETRRDSAPRNEELLALLRTIRVELEDLRRHLSR
ncbi:MAG: MerR family transcriptional regulator [Candidatus Sumerlaeia bacterium]|nr:MerR family transcriptional regulator [Candidatus Sumerlaeia bacterium]